MQCESPKSIESAELQKPQKVQLAQKIRKMPSSVSTVKIRLPLRAAEFRGQPSLLNYRTLHLLARDRAAPARST